MRIETKGTTTRLDQYMRDTKKNTDQKIDQIEKDNKTVIKQMNENHKQMMEMLTGRDNDKKQGETLSQNTAMHIETPTRQKNHANDGKQVTSEEPRVRMLELLDTPPGRRTSDTELYWQDPHILNSGRTATPIESQLSCDEDETYAAETQ
jgi:hypothetical protein